MIPEDPDDLRSDEQDLRGAWVGTPSGLDVDATAARIERLTAGRLERLLDGPDGWEILFRDPRDGRFWELTYPLSHLQGGGPPRLTNVSPDVVRDKYRWRTA